MPRGRKSSSVLNQTKETEIPEKIFNEELQKEIDSELEKKIEENIVEEPVNVEVEPFEPEVVPEPEPEVEETPEVEVEVEGEESETVEKPVPLAKKLSAEQMKLYQRTGILPK